MHNVPTAAGDGAVVVVGRSQRVVPLLGRGGTGWKWDSKPDSLSLTRDKQTDPGCATSGEGEEVERESEIKKTDSLSRDKLTRVVPLLGRGTGWERKCNSERDRLSLTRDKQTDLGRATPGEGEQVERESEIQEETACYQLGTNKRVNFGWWDAPTTIDPHTGATGLGCLVVTPHNTYNCLWTPMAIPRVKKEADNYNNRLFINT